jgi:voltage-gated potassium channel
MQSSRSYQPPRRLARGLVIGGSALVTVWLVGSVGYKLIAPQASWIDCFYMTFITVATIGYAEVIDLTASPAGRVFTMVIAFVGIGVSTYIFSAVVAYLVEGRINEVIWRMRMEKRISRLSGHYILCGIGRIGRNVAGELSSTARTYVIIDESRENIAAHVEHEPGVAFIVGDASDDDLLQKAHIDSAVGLFAVTGEDSKNLLITITAKQLNPEIRVVARCHEVRNIDKIRKAGADAIVSPDFTGGLRIASAMLRPHVVSFLDEMLRADSHLRVEEIVVPGGFPETRLGELNLRSADYILLAIRDHGQWRFNPSDAEPVKAGNTLIVMATPSGRSAIERAVGWV